MIGLFIVFAVIILVAALGLYRSYQRHKAMEAFAAARGWAALACNDLTLAGYVPQRLARFGDSHAYDLAYQIAVNARPAVVFGYTYTDHSTDAEGHRTSTSKNFAILAFQLPGMPPLEVLRHSFFNKLTSIGQHLDSLKLEGDFNKDFDVFAPDNTQIASLSLLTPDTMVLMQDNGRSFSLQIQGDWVIIYGDYKYLAPKTIDLQIGYAGKLEAELTQKLHGLAPAIQ